MRKQLVLFFIGATIAAGCGETDKKEAKRDFLIDKDRAVSVSRLAMRTAALAGRHSVIPKGQDTNPDNARKCPVTGELNKIVIKPACKPDFAGAVDCVFTEVYDCPAIAGTIKNQVHMGTDSLDFTLSMKGYREGNEALGFINYTGAVTASTTPDGKTVYSSGIGVVARSLGDTADTIADSSGTITVTTSATTLVFNGMSFLNTPLGKATMELNDIDFGDCPISPKSGTIELALVGFERAQLRADGCGDMKLVHFVGDVASGEEKMSDEELISAFGSSISDVTIFRGVTTNTEKAAPAMYPERWCVPFVAGVSTLLASSVTGPAPAVVLPAPTVTNPLMECLIFKTPVPITGATFAHIVLEDKTGIGAFGDPTNIDVHFFRAGVMAENVAQLAGANMMIYAQAYVAEALPKAYVTFKLAANGDLAGTDLTTLCNPAQQDPMGAQYCSSRYTFNETIDHFGLGLVGAAPYNLGTFWYVHTFVGP